MEIQKKPQEIILSYSHVAANPELVRRTDRSAGLEKPTMQRRLNPEKGTHAKPITCRKYLLSISWFEVLIAPEPRGLSALLCSKSRWF
jgi:hypothetical protein